MSTRFSTKELGYMKESSYGIDPILVGSELHKFGRYTIPFGKFGSPIYQKAQYNLPHVSREPQEITITSKLYQHNAFFDAVSAIPFAYMLGSVAYNSNTFTITPLAPGTEKDSRTIRSKRQSGNITLIEHLSGAKTTNLMWVIDRSNDGAGIASYVEEYKGITMATSALNPASPILVGNDLPYRYTLSATLGSTNIEPELHKISLMINDNGIPLNPEINAIETDRITDGLQLTYKLSIEEVAGKSSTLWDYFRDATNGTTKEDFTHRVYQNATNYIDIVCENLSPIGEPTLENKKDGTEYYSYDFDFDGITVIEYNPDIDQGDYP